MAIKKNREFEMELDQKHIDKIKTKLENNQEKRPPQSLYKQKKTNRHHLEIHNNTKTMFVVFFIYIYI